MESETSTALIVGLGSLILAMVGVLLAVIMVSSRKKVRANEIKMRLLLRDQQIELLRATAKAEEKQKMTIAAQLHDEVIPIIASVTGNISGYISAYEKQGTGHPELGREVEKLSLLQEDIRKIIHGIVPELFDSFGLLKAFEAYIRQANVGMKSAIEFHNDTVFVGKIPLAQDEQLLVFKVFRELINNLQKHTEFDYLKISLVEVEPDFTILFSHDGQGVTNLEIETFKHNSTGMGLKLLESRVLFLGGSLKYYNENEISYIKLTVPIKHEE